MPLMATTGETAIKTQVSYDEYLQSRSSIEFVKSELEKIVEQELPYTFAVVQDADDFYRAIKKKETASISLDYLAFVNADGLDDRKDVPLADNAGNTVTAICAVTRNEDDPNIYDITIITFNKGKKGLIYTAIFTPRGSLLIYPEAYKQEQALPLSDFVLVDGKMGSYEAWNSTIKFQTATDLGSFTESLLPWKLNPEPEYASSLGYPAVFKTAALAAVGASDGFSDPLDDGKITDEIWIHATAVSKSSTKTAGNVWIEVNNRNIKVYLQTSERMDITDDCTIYVNGKVTADKKLPDSYGYYQISVDYTGTDYSTPSNPERYDASKFNVLPFMGMQMPDIQGSEAAAQQQKLDNVTASIEKITRVEHERDPETNEEVPPTYDVTINLNLKNNAKSDNILYGYVEEGTERKNGKYPVTWQSSNVIKDLEAGKTYYFYICRAAAFVDGVFYTDSDIKPAGMIYPKKYVEALESGERYLMMNADGSSLMTSNISMEAVPHLDGIINHADVESNVWTVTGSGESWKIANSSGKSPNISGAIVSGEPSGDSVEHKVEWYEHLFGGHNCTKYNKYNVTNWNFTISSAENITFNTDYDGEGFSLCKEVTGSVTIHHDESKGAALLALSRGECLPDPPQQLLDMFH